jgi:hypothetical protein
MLDRLLDWLHRRWPRWWPAPILVALLAISACGEAGYEFQPDRESGSTSTDDIECGVVTFWHSNGFTKWSRGIGHFCLEH